MKTSPDVALINMPFAHLLSPSIGLGLLKAGLSRSGVAAKTFNFQINFAKLIGTRAYSRIYSETHTQDLVGEWVFSDSLFGQRSGAEVEPYVNDVLRGQALGPSDNHAYDDGAVEAIALDIVAARAEVEGVLEECLEAVAACRPKVVGFTSLFHQHVASLSLARRIKARLPETFVVFGGPNCEGEMGRETLRQFEFVDAVVSGEGDFVFPELVGRVLGGEPFADLEGVFSRGRRPSLASLQPPVNARTIEDLDALPVPDYDEYFEQIEAISPTLPRKPTLLFETSRGCWWGEKHHCTFCGLNGATMAYRSKSAARALDELAYLADRHPGFAFNVVDNILDMAYFKDFIPVLAERKQGFNLFYEVKANLKKEQLRLLREAGVSMIQPGVESFSDNVLRLMRKGVSGLQNIQLIKWCQEVGLKGYYFLIWGFPGETAEDYLEMARLVPLITHLPPPRGAATIRIDRFSPNFDQAEQLGFKNLAPYPAYRHVYPFAPEVLKRLAYFFTFEYAAPRDVLGYVKPLADELARWRKCHGESRLFWVEKGERLLVWDTRPVAAEALTVLTGRRKFVYMACDQIRTARQVAELWRKGSDEALDEAEVQDALDSFTERGLMLRQENSYLSLAVAQTLTGGGAAAR